MQTSLYGLQKQHRSYDSRRANLNRGILWSESIGIDYESKKNTKDTAFCCVDNGKLYTTLRGNCKSPIKIALDICVIDMTIWR